MDSQTTMSAIIDQSEQRVRAIATPNDIKFGASEKLLVVAAGRTHPEGAIPPPEIPHDPDARRSALHTAATEYSGAITYHPKGALFSPELGKAGGLQKITITPGGGGKQENTMGVDILNPFHYRSHPSGVECIQVTEHMNFNLGNAIKYIWRAGLKSNGIADDIRKAIWYLERELKRASN